MSCTNAQLGIYSFNKQITKRMTNRLLQRTIWLMVFGLMLCMQASAKDFKFSFAEEIPSGWTASNAPYQFETLDQSRGAQFTTNSTLTLKGVKNATKVTIVCSCNNIEGKNKLAVSVAGKEWGNVALPKQNMMTQTFTGNAASGDVKIDITRDTKSVYISEVVITADECDGYSEQTPGTDTGDYSWEWEPTTMTTINTTFDECFYADYSEDAGKDYTLITFENEDYTLEMGVFAKTVKGTVIAPGTYVVSKKGEAGTVQASPGGDDEYDYPTFVAADWTYYEDYGWQYSTSYYIDNGTLTVEKTANGVKMTLDAKTHFGSTFKGTFEGVAKNMDEEEDDDPVNPGTGDEDDDPYLYEPLAASTFNITFDEVECSDYSDEDGDYVDLYFVSDDYEMEVGVYAPAADGTGIAPGTYTIDFSNNAGTVQASEGCYYYMDMPSFMATNFEWIEEGQDDGYWYYDTYYMVSGTMKVEKVTQGAKFTINAKSKNGSTINATYTGPVKFVSTDEPEDGINDINAASKAPTKTLKDGKILIQRNGHTYTTSGLLVK